MPVNATPAQVEETWKYLTDVDAEDNGHIFASLIKVGGIPLGFVIGKDATSTCRRLGLEEDRRQVPVNGAQLFKTDQYLINLWGIWWQPLGYDRNSCHGCHSRVRIAIKNEKNKTGRPMGPYQSHEREFLPGWH